MAKIGKRSASFNLRANVEEKQLEYFAHMCFQMQQSKKREKQKRKACHTTCKATPAKHGDRKRFSTAPDKASS